MKTGVGRHPPGEDDAPGSDPDDERQLARSVGRPLLLVFWTLVVWGTVYGALFALAVVTDGPSDALDRATAEPGRIVGIANLSLAAIALGVWAFAGFTLVRLRSDRRSRLRY